MFTYVDCVVFAVVCCGVWYCLLFWLLLNTDLCLLRLTCWALFDCYLLFCLIRLFCWLAFVGGGLCVLCLVCVFVVLGVLVFVLVWFLFNLGVTLFGFVYWLVFRFVICALSCFVVLLVRWFELVDCFVRCWFLVWFYFGFDLNWLLEFCC